MPRGRAPKPALQVVREGNPGHRPVRESVVLPPSQLVEPDWAHLEPEVAADASRLWQRVAPVLFRSIGLVHEQQVTLDDYCLTYARIRQGERVLSVDGVVVEGARGGVVKNPWTTVLNQYRANLRSLGAELGLTPSAASRLSRPMTEDDDDPFD